MADRPDRSARRAGSQSLGPCVRNLSRSEVMRVLLKMIAFGMAVGCLSYTSRAVDFCDPAGATVAEKRKCNGNISYVCETETVGGVDSCKAHTRTISVATDYFGCKSNGDNPAPPLLGTRCIDSGNTTTCATVANCTMVWPPPRIDGIPVPGIGGGYIWSWVVQDPPVCTAGAPMTISSPTKTTVPCSSILI